MLLAALCLVVTLVLVVLLVAARRALRTECRDWVESEVEPGVVLVHDPGYSEETRRAALEAVRRARRGGAVSP